jgi:aminotransferase
MTTTANKPKEGTALRYDLMDLAARTPDVISLGRGDPDLATPSHIVAAAKEAVKHRPLDLSPIEGLPELRQAIAAKLRRDNGLEVGPENVLVTTGGQEALFLLIQALLDPGDEILVPDPRYTSYDQAIQMAGGKIVLVPTTEVEAFDLDADAVRERITPRTKAILIVTPGNPTAGIVTRKNIERIAEIAKEHDLIVISDEIYEKFVYDGWEHVSIGALPGMAERTITLNGFSKTYAMTGWRVGYIAAPVTFVRAVTRFKEVTNLAAPTPSQWGAHAALTGLQTTVDEFRAIYAERRALMKDALDEIGFTYGDPRGAFYVFANTRSTGMNATEFAYQLLERGRVLVFPGAGFGAAWEDYVRISLLQPKEKLVRALERLVDASKSWS